MRADVELTSFTKGEVSPRLKGRTDYKGYYDACETVKNMVVMPQGGLTRRPGTIFAHEVKSSSNRVRLVPFLFSTTQAYMLEFGPQYVRFYRNGGLITNNQAISNAANNGSGAIRLTVPSTTGMANDNTVTVSGVTGTTEANGTWLITVISGTTLDLQGSTFTNAYVSGGTAAVIVEIGTAYTANDLRQLNFTQSADTLYVVHPLYKPRKITRSSNTYWAIADITFYDGPYLDTNTLSTTLTPSGTTGAITITASSVVGINATGTSTGQGWLSTDVGRKVRINNGAAWGYAEITSRTSATVVNATVVSDFAATTATTNWRLGKWSDTTGWPWLTTFWQQRQIFAGTNNQPNAIEASRTSAFDNFAPTELSGTVTDTCALSWVLSDDQVNATRWISAAGSAQTMQLGIGTDGSEHILQAATTSQALTPTSVQAYRETSLGSIAYVPALRIGKSVLFVNASGRKLYDWLFDWQVNGYRGTDRTVESEHLTQNGLYETTYQKNPLGVLWACRTDGKLIGFTYLVEQGVFAWHQHVLGGDYYDSDPVVESVACIPSPDGTYDQLWLAVKRTINGSVKRYVELMAPYFDDQAQEEAVFLDSSLTSALTNPSGTLTPSAMTGTGVNFVVTGAAPFAAGDVGSIIRVNDGRAIVTGFTSTTTLVGDWLTGYPATSLAPATTGNWSLTAKASTFSGASHLVAETVGILGDGADCGTAVVDSGGNVTISGSTASYATIGLQNNFRMVTMPFEPQRAVSASSQGRIKTVAHMYLRLLRTMGLRYGRQVTDPMTNGQEDRTDALQTRSAGMPPGLPPPLYTGVTRLPMPGSHDQEGQILVKGDGPFPCTVLAINATGDVGENPGPG